MAHIPPLRSTATQQFEEVHFGKPPQVVHDHRGQPLDSIVFSLYSPQTFEHEPNHAVGETGRALQNARDAVSQTSAYYMNQGELVESPALIHELNVTQELTHIVRLKKSLTHKKSEEALSLLEYQLKDFGKTPTHTLLEARLLGDSGFKPLARFMGGDDETNAFAARILKRHFENYINASLRERGGWGNLNVEEIAQQQAEDVVAAYAQERKVTSRTDELLTMKRALESHGYDSQLVGEALDDYADGDAIETISANLGINLDHLPVEHWGQLSGDDQQFTRGVLDAVIGDETAHQGAVTQA
jgi:hypothetical protein